VRITSPAGSDSGLSFPRQLAIRLDISTADDDIFPRASAGYRRAEVDLVRTDHSTGCARR
jgi:hypothetical protein